MSIIQRHDGPSRTDDRLGRDAHDGREVLVVKDELRCHGRRILGKIEVDETAFKRKVQSCRSRVEVPLELTALECPLVIQIRDVDRQQVSQSLTLIKASSLRSNSSWNRKDLHFDILQSDPFRSNGMRNEQQHGRLSNTRACKVSQSQSGKILSPLE